MKNLIPIYLEFNSWTLIAFQNINPREFLEYLTSNFEFIYHILSDGTLNRLKDDASLLGFLHENLVNHGCVDDLLLRKRDGVISSGDFLTKQLTQVTEQRDQNSAVRDQAIIERDQAIIERDHAIIERDQTITRDQAIIERDQAVLERDLLYKSLSWRITSPLRWVKRLFI